MRTRKQTVYFAHGKSQYGTLTEAGIIDHLKGEFPAAKVINPGSFREPPAPPRGRARVAVRKFLETDSCGQCWKRDACKIDNFLKLVWDAAVVVQFPLGAKCGVACELRFARAQGKVIYLVGTHWCLHREDGEIGKHGRSD